MTLPTHLDAAARRVEDATGRVERARALPPSAESQRAWIEALTDLVLALVEVHEYTNESVHEKLHALAARLQVPGFPAVGPPRR